MLQTSDSGNESRLASRLFQDFAVMSRAPIIGRAKFAYGEICAADVVKEDRQGNEVARAISRRRRANWSSTSRRNGLRAHRFAITTYFVVRRKFSHEENSDFFNSIDQGLSRRPVRVQLFSRRTTQSETASPLLMSACTRPSIMKVGDTWIPFWRAYLQCSLISRSRSGVAKASESLAPL